MLRLIQAEFGNLFFGEGRADVAALLPPGRKAARVRDQRRVWQAELAKQVFQSFTVVIVAMGQYNMRDLFQIHSQRVRVSNHNIGVSGIE